MLKMKHEVDFYKFEKNTRRFMLGWKIKELISVKRSMLFKTV